MKGFLFVSGILFLLVGFGGLAQPAEYAGRFGMALGGVDGLNQMRATAGGVTLGCGLLLLLGTFYDHLARAALGMATVVLGGLVTGRLISLMIDGVPARVVWLSAGVELLGFAQALFWFLDDLKSRKIEE